MTRDDILRIVEQHRTELALLRVRELALFGSFARGEGSETSDIDFFLDLEETSFDAFMSVKELLESALDRRIDLVMKSTIKPRLREHILAEAIRAA